MFRRLPRQTRTRGGAKLHLIFLIKSNQISNQIKIKSQISRFVLIQAVQKIRHSSLVCRCGFAVIIVFHFSQANYGQLSIATHFSTPFWTIGKMPARKKKLFSLCVIQIYQSIKSCCLEDEINLRDQLPHGWRVSQGGRPSWQHSGALG